MPRTRTKKLRKCENCCPDARADFVRDISDKQDGIVWVWKCTNCGHEVPTGKCRDYDKPSAKQKELIEHLEREYITKGHGKVHVNFDRYSGTVGVVFGGGKWYDTSYVGRIGRRGSFKWQCINRDKSPTYTHRPTYR